MGQGPFGLRLHVAEACVDWCCMGQRPVWIAAAWGKGRPQSPPLQGGVAARVLCARTGRFYERGCQEKYLPADGRPGQNSVVAASPTSVVRVCWSGTTSFRSFITASAWSSETEKQRGRCADHSSI